VARKAGDRHVGENPTAGILSSSFLSRWARKSWVRNIRDCSCSQCVPVVGCQISRDIRVWPGRPGIAMLERIQPLAFSALHFCSGGHSSVARKAGDRYVGGNPTAGFLSSAFLFGWVLECGREGRGSPCWRESNRWLSQLPICDSVDGVVVGA
jgi:hypothetical protein